MDEGARDKLASLRVENKRMRAALEWADDLFACIATIKDLRPEQFTAQMAEAYRGYADAANKLDRRAKATLSPHPSSQETK